MALETLPCEPQRDQTTMMFTAAIDLSGCTCLSNLHGACELSGPVELLHAMDGQD